VTAAEPLRAHDERAHRCPRLVLRELLPLPSL